MARAKLPLNPLGMFARWLVIRLESILEEGDIIDFTSRPGAGSQMSAGSVDSVPSDHISSHELADTRRGTPGPSHQAISPSSPGTTNLRSQNDIPDWRTGSICFTNPEELLSTYGVCFPEQKIFASSLPEQEEYGLIDWTHEAFPSSCSTLCEKVGFDVDQADLQLAQVPDTHCFHRLYNLRCAASFHNFADSLTRMDPPTIATKYRDHATETVLAMYNGTLSSASQRELQVFGSILGKAVHDMRKGTGFFKGFTHSRERPDLRLKCSVFRDLLATMKSSETSALDKIAADTARAKFEAWHPRARRDYRDSFVPSNTHAVELARQRRTRDAHHQSKLPKPKAYRPLLQHEP